MASVKASLGGFLGDCIQLEIRCENQFQAIQAQLDMTGKLRWFGGKDIIADMIGLRFVFSQGENGLASIEIVLLRRMVGVRDGAFTESASVLLDCSALQTGDDYEIEVSQPEVFPLQPLH